jgi:hypothetical protein
MVLPVDVLSVQMVLIFAGSKVANCIECCSLPHYLMLLQKLCGFLSSTYRTSLLA